MHKTKPSEKTINETIDACSDFIKFQEEVDYSKIQEYFSNIENIHGFKRNVLIPVIEGKEERKKKADRKFYAFHKKLHSSNIYIWNEISDNNFFGTNYMINVYLRDTSVTNISKGLEFQIDKNNSHWHYDDNTNHPEETKYQELGNNNTETKSIITTQSKILELKQYSLFQVQIKGTQETINVEQDKDGIKLLWKNENQSKIIKKIIKNYISLL